MTTTLPPRQLDPVIKLLLETMSHTFDVAGILRSGAPDGYPTDRLEDADHRRAAPHAVRAPRRGERARAERAARRPRCRSDRRSAS